MTDAERLAALAPAIMSAFHSFRPGPEQGDRLSMRQYQALMIIGSRGGTTLTQLGGMLQIAPSTATELADRMVELGYLERSRDAGDHRSVLVSLSAQGADLLRRRGGDLAGLFDNMLAAMDPDDRAAFVRAFSTIGEIADRIAGVNRSPCP